MSRYARYSAAVTKARAMYAHRLTESDWTQLAALESPRRIADYLRQSGAWPLAAATDDAQSLCSSLSDELHDRYRRLCLYLPKARDREYMAFFLKRKTHALSYDNADYEKLSECIERSYRGLSRLAMKKLLGAEADMLNLVYLLRLRRFPASLDGARERLIPVRMALGKKLIDALLAAPDDDAVLRLLQPTPWADTLRDISPAALDSAYERYMESFCQKLVAGGDPSAAVPMAYMMLSELARLRLTRLIQRTKQGR